MTSHYRYVCNHKSHTPSHTTLLTVHIKNSQTFSPKAFEPNRSTKANHSESTFEPQSQENYMLDLYSISGPTQPVIGKLCATFQLRLIFRQSISIMIGPDLECSQNKDGSAEIGFLLRNTSEDITSLDLCYDLLFIL